MNCFKITMQVDASTNWYCTVRIREGTKSVFECLHKLIGSRTNGQ